MTRPLDTPIRSDPRATPAGGRPSNDRKALAVCLAIGFVARLVYIVSMHITPTKDTRWYEMEAATLARGAGFVAPLGPPRPTAAWPPGYPVFLSIAHRVGITTFTGYQILGAAVGLSTIALAYALGRRWCTREAALLGALLVALSPFLIAADASVMSEVLEIPIVMGLLVLGSDLAVRPTTARWAAFGALAGAGALVRGEVVVYAVAIGGAVALFAGARNSVRGALVAAAMIAAFVLPWMIRNAIEVHTFTLASSTATVIAGANCRASYTGRALGDWSVPCINPLLHHTATEAVWDRTIMHAGLSYARSHPAGAIRAVGARVLRIWGLWSPRTVATGEAKESRRFAWQLGAWFVYVPIAILAAFALIRRRVRRLARYMSIAMIVAVTLVGAVTYGNQRFRTPVEPVLAILAAAALVPPNRRAPSPNQR